MRWRLIVHEPMDGAMNMAVDEAILHAHMSGAVPATVRFFRWSPPAVSIGYFQSAIQEVDGDACAAMGVDLVRRPTGGRAVLHDKELTYSLVAGVHLPQVCGTILESYRKISSALICGLELLGVAAEMKPIGQDDTRSDDQSQHEDGPTRGKKGATAACFDVPSDYEIAVTGRKLVGSAQVRHGDTLLQHGSILLDFDPAAIFQVLRPPPGADVQQLTAWLARRVTSLSETLQRSVRFDEVAEALSAGMAQCLGVELDPGDLTPEEWRAASSLKAEKYGDVDWNLRS